MKKILAIIILLVSFIGLTSCTKQETITDTTGSEQTIAVESKFYNEHYDITIRLGADGILYTTAKDGGTTKKNYQQYDNMIFAEDGSGYSTLYYLTENGKELIQISISSSNKYYTTIYVKQ